MLLVCVSKCCRLTALLRSSVGGHDGDEACFETLTAVCDNSVGGHDGGKACFGIIKSRPYGVNSCLPTLTILAIILATYIFFPSMITLISLQLFRVPDDRIAQLRY